MRSNNLLLLTIIALAAGSAYYIPGIPAAPTKTSSDSQAASSVQPPPHDEIRTDALTLMAEYFGVDISLGAFEGRLRKVVANCQDPNLACANEAVTLGDFCSLDFDDRSKACTEGDNPEPADEQRARTIETVIDSYVGSSSGSSNLAKFRSRDRTPAIIRLLKREASGESVAEKYPHRIDVKFLIATLPDYVDSHMRWDFDAMSSAVQAGANNQHFVLDRFYLPDWDPTHDLETGSHLLRKSHETNPGVILFRRGQSSDYTQELLVLSVVAETPTAGIHKEAFQSAARLADEWERGSVIKVLGPMYSGSRESLLDVIRAFRQRRDPNSKTPFNLVSGSATAQSNLA